MNVNNLKKGTLLIVKSPPYYKDEFLYEVTAAGDKLIRATLQHSPKVRKSWTKEELSILFNLGIVKLSDNQES